MPSFAERLFAPSPFLRWTLGTVSMVSALLFASWLPDQSGLALWVGLACESLLMRLCLAMLAPRRLAWTAARVLCGLLFLGNVAYVIGRSVEKPASFAAWDGSRGESTGFNALLGLIVIGLPALGFAWRRGGFPVPVTPPEAADASGPHA